MTQQKRPTAEAAGSIQFHNNLRLTLTHAGLAVNAQSAGERESLESSVKSNHGGARQTWTASEVSRTSGQSDINRAKQQLPLPELMATLGDQAHARRSSRCPFHEDHSPSFSIFRGRGGVWLWKCHAGCGHGDGVDYLKLKLGLSTGEAIRKYLDLAGIAQGGGR